MPKIYEPSPVELWHQAERECGDPVKRRKRYHELMVTHGHIVKASPVEQLAATVHRDQCNGRTLACVNCGSPLGEKHTVLCHAYGTALSHARHLTDGRWHDNCQWCKRRRRLGGTGLEPEGGESGA